MLFTFFLTFLLIQRLSELVIAAKNEKFLRGKGAIEYGSRHYSSIVLLHAFFIVSLIAEYLYRQEAVFYPVFLLLFLAIILLKFWVIFSLGNYWNTKILRVPDMPPLKKGPYKYFRHPNYILVIGEIAVIPLIFGLYYTALVFSVLNALALRIRIREENKAWKE